MTSAYSSQLLYARDSNNIEILYNSPSPRYSVLHDETLKSGMDYLNENGYVVISDCFDQKSTDLAINFYWQFLENLPSPYKMLRSKPETWDKFVGSSYNGIISSHGIGQSQFLWHLRGNPLVKKVFSSIWNTEDLLTSFDGACLFRPYHLVDKPWWKTRSGWFHVDQNPIGKPNKICIQGLVSLYDANETTGGLIVIPKSHNRFSTELAEKCTTYKHMDFVEVSVLRDKLLNEALALEDWNRMKGNTVFNPAKLVHCKAGDLVLWDSRTIHCNTPPLVDLKPTENSNNNNNNDNIEMLRMVGYVCMTPSSYFSESCKEEMLDRIGAFEMKITSNHWPHEYHIADEPNLEILHKENFELNALQRGLITGKHNTKSTNIKDLTVDVQDWITK